MLRIELKENMTREGTRKPIYEQVHKGGRQRHCTRSDTYTWCTSRESNPGLNDGNINNINNIFTNNANCSSSGSNNGSSHSNINSNSNGSSNVSINRIDNVRSNSNINGTINITINGTSSGTCNIISNGSISTVAMSVVTCLSFVYGWVCSVGGRGCCSIGGGGWRVDGM